MPINQNLEEDSLYKSMQSFYERLGQIPAQIMFIQTQHLNFERKPVRELVNQLRYGQQARPIGNSLKVGLYLD